MQYRLLKQKKQQKCVQQLLVRSVKINLTFSIPAHLTPVSCNSAMSQGSSSIRAAVERAGAMERDFFRGTKGTYEGKREKLFKMRFVQIYDLYSDVHCSYRQVFLLASPQIHPLALVAVPLSVKYKYKFRRCFIEPFSVL